jgi:hypothetical protein
LALLLFIQQVKIAAPQKQFFKRYLRTKSRQRIAQLFGDPKFQQQQVVFFKLSL